MKKRIVLELKEICKSFSGINVLNSINLKIQEGSVHALVGENGAGKSTMMKIISGMYTPDSGEVIYKGKALQHLTPEKSLDLGISMIHQELSPEPYMTVAENIFLGGEPLKQGPLRKMVNFKKLYSDAQTILEQMNVALDVHKKMNELSLAAKQMIEIAKAVSRNASVIIMDEPTSALTDDEVSILFRQIAELKKQGVAIVYITHKMDEIFTLADDVTVIRDGSVVASAPKSEYTMDSLITQMVGREIRDIYPKYKVPIGERVVEVSHLTGRGFEDISFSIHKGEILGIAGLVGAGRTEVARGIFGLDRLKRGEICIEGQAVSISNTNDAIRHGIAMIPEDRGDVGLVLCRTIRENISLASLQKLSSGGFLHLSEEKRKAEEMVHKLRIKIASLESPVRSLSGGNQQKVVLAKWMLQDVKLLILDEPTRGIDVGSKSEIYQMMCQFAEQGMAILMISSELPEILGMSDRILVMHNGHITGELPAAEATQEVIMRYAVQ